ncbi:hypothetical protein [Legionella sp. W05-934-2]|uniref:hypothetical protein n=1 Tax=Legionella sp. W05-934-2 TaxID=1198649 RepID=UPI0034637661
MLFFNRGPGLTLLQMINVGALGLSLYELSSNPDSNRGPLVTDALVHGLTTLSLRQGSNFLENMGVSTLNVLRAGMVLQAAMTGDTLPIAVLAVDFALHSLNGLVSLLNGANTPNVNDKDDTPSAAKNK